MLQSHQLLMLASALAVAFHDSMYVLVCSVGAEWLRQEQVLRACYIVVYLLYI